jgi:drug/metabolite transporter (DMT)-like permease
LKLLALVALSGALSQPLVIAEDRHRILNIRSCEFQCHAASLSGHPSPWKEHTVRIIKASLTRCVLIESMAGKWSRTHAVKAAPVAGLLFLCFLWSLGSLRIDLLPASAAVSLPPLEKEALSFGLLTITASLLAIAKGTKWPLGRQLYLAFLIGLGLFVAPALLVSLSNQGVSELTRVALFSLVPVFTVVLEPHISGTTGQQRRGALIAALLAVGGTLCIFPADVPTSIASAASFGAIVLAAAFIGADNCLAVKVAEETPITSIAAVASVTALACLAVLGPFVEKEAWQWQGVGPELAWSVALDLPGLLLLFWLMPRMSAVRMSARFVIAPLMATLFGVVLFRPEVSLRALLGLVLVAAGAGWILFAPEEEADDASLPLNLSRE